MTWWNIIKISEKARQTITDRYRRKASNPRGQQQGQAKDVSRKAKNCEMCGQKKSLRAINYYPPMKALCNTCAKFKYGDNYKAKATKIEDE